MRLASSSRADGLHRPRRRRRRRWSAATSRRSLPLIARETSSRSSISCVCARALRSMAAIARGLLVSRHLAREHPRPAVDRGERRAQLVGHRHQELVLQIARGFGLRAARAARARAPPRAVSFASRRRSASSRCTSISSRSTRNPRVDDGTAPGRSPAKRQHRAPNAATRCVAGDASPRGRPPGSARSRRPAAEWPSAGSR